MIELSEKLAAGFTALQRSRAAHGFWDDGAGTFVRALRGVQGEQGAEPPDLRYTPFGLAGALRAHRQSGVGDAERLQCASRWALKAVPATPSLDDLFYGGLWSLIESALTWGDEAYAMTASGLVLERAEAFRADSNLNLGVGLFAMAQLAAREGANPAVKDLVAAKATQFAASVNARGIPATGDRRAAYHQRMMYCAWGLAAAARLLDGQEEADATLRILTRVVDDRLDEDGGIRWHAVIERNVMPDGGNRFYPWGHHIYYECHQCFFANAVELYEACTGDRRFHDLRKRAIEFIFGVNRWGIALDEHGVPGLPARCIAKDGDMSLWRNRFKGCYEVGAYLWALSSSLRDDAPAVG